MSRMPPPHSHARSSDRPPPGWLFTPPPRVRTRHAAVRSRLAVGGAALVVLVIVMAVLVL